MIGLTRRRIAGRMIVDKNRRVGRVNDGRAKNLARVRDTFVQRAKRHVLNRPGAVISCRAIRPAKQFAVTRLKFSAKCLVDDLRTVEYGSLGPAPRKALPQFEGRREFCCLGRSDAGDSLRKFRRLTSGQRPSRIPWTSEVRLRARSRSCPSRRFEGKIASNSASVRQAAPCAVSFSRGRSLGGISRMRTEEELVRRRSWIKTRGVSHQSVDQSDQMIGDGL